MDNRLKMLHIRKALEAFVLMATDEQAATFPSLYSKWKSGETVKAGDRRFYEPDGKLYKVRDGGAHTTQSTWTPDISPSLWSVIDAARSGKQYDPIPASRNMEYVYGLYYTDPEDGKLYKCARIGEADGGTITLAYLPHELVGNYFEEAA